jgi:hypothetical protein
VKVENITFFIKPLFQLIHKKAAVQVNSFYRQPLLIVHHTGINTNDKQIDS